MFTMTCHITTAAFFAVVAVVAVVVHLFKINL